MRIERPVPIPSGVRPHSRIWHSRRPRRTRQALAVDQGTVLGDLTIQSRRSDDDQRAGGHVVGHNEAVGTVPGHEHEAACGSGPLAVIAEPMYLTDEDIEHLILTSVMMRWDRETGRICTLHDAELPECVLGGGLDDHASSSPVVSGTLIDTVNIPTHIGSTPAAPESSPAT